MNLHIYQTGIAHESRLQRHCIALKEAGVFSDVEFLGCALNQFDRNEIFEGGILATLLRKRDSRSLSFFNKLIDTLGWEIRAFNQARAKKPAVVTCHSLPVLPLCLAIKIAVSCKVVYEPHELETETIVSRGIRKKIAKVVEGFLISYCDAVIVVSNEISQWYAHAYKIKPPKVVRNMPRALQGVNQDECHETFREKFKIPPDGIIFLYQGYVGHGRRVRQYLRVFEELGDPFYIVFMGSGELASEIIDAAHSASNIFYQESVPSEEVLRYTVGADVGLCGVENVCLSYFFSLPNKMFEFLAAGIPCFAPEYHEMKSFVQRYGVGWTHGEADKDLVSLIHGLNRGVLNEKRENIKSVQPNLCWDAEKVVLIDSYRDL